MKRAYVCLGRLGDILNILPIVYADSLKGERSTVVCSYQFASIMEGVSYADCISVNTHYSKPREVLDRITESGRFDLVRAAQVYGMGAPPRANNFQEDAYHIAGRHNDFWKYPLIIDQRSERREQELCNQFFRLKPWLLYAGNGHSSQFQHSDHFWRWLTNKWGEHFEIISLASIEAHRFYDLLGLFERSALLVSIDTGHLHLARASQIPVIAFRTDKPSRWYGAKPPDQTVLSVWYGEYSDKLKEVDSAIQKILTP